ncbi:MAG: T9SS type A sorting domain-containing protein [Bacteroidota bacterium]
MNTKTLIALCITTCLLLNAKILLADTGLDDVSIRITTDVDPPTVPRCDEFNYIVTITNNCPTPVTDFKVVFRFQDFHLLISSLLDFEVDQGIVTNSHQIETPLISTIASGETMEFRVRMMANNDVEEIQVRAGIVSGSDSRYTPVFEISPVRTYYVLDGDLLLSDLLSEPFPPLRPADAACYDPIENDPSQNTWQQILVDGRLTVDVDYCIRGVGNNRAQLFITAGSEVVVTNGASLAISNADVFGCRELFKSITVEDGLLNANDVTFSGGEYAIQVLDGSRAIINNCIFQDNYVSISVPEGSTIPQEVDLSIKNSIFEGTGSMLPRYDGQITEVGDFPYAGIEVFGMPGLSIGGIPQWSCAFRKMSNGIIARSTNLQVANSSFIDMVEVSGAVDYEPTGTGIFVEGEGQSLVQTGYGKILVDVLSFDNCVVGIAGRGCNMDISENVMKNVTTGISVENSQSRSVEILDNIIAAQKIGIRLYNNTPLSGYIHDNGISADYEANPRDAFCIYANESPNVPTVTSGGWVIDNNLLQQLHAAHGIFYRGGAFGSISSNSIDWTDPDWEEYVGIKIEGTAGFLLTCNDIDGNARPDVGNFKNGIGIQIIGSYSNGVRCNYVDQTRFGINILGMSDMPNSFRNNIMDDNFVGLQLGGVSDGGNAVIGEQYHEGNSWPGPYAPQYGGHGARHLSAEVDVVNSSRFFVNSNQQNGYLPTFQAVTSWFLVDPFNLSRYNCIDDNACPGGIGYQSMFTDTEEELDVKLAQGDILTTKFSQALNWTADRHLYFRWSENSGRITVGSPVEQFMAAAQANSIGAFGRVDEQLRSVFELLPSDEAQLRSYESQISLQLDHLHSLDETQTIERAAALANLMTAESQRAGLVEQLADEREKTVTDIVTDNSTLSDGEVFEANQKAFNQVYLETVASGDFDFSTAQVATLEDIANQCPWSGGDAVFYARSLLAGEGLVHYDDELLCDDSQPRVGALEPAELAEGGMVAYPNPAQRLLTLELVQPVAEPQQLMVSNSLGQVVYETRISASQKQIHLDISRWQNGLYLCTLIDKEGQSFTEKIQVLK